MSDASIQSIVEKLVSLMGFESATVTKSEVAGQTIYSIGNVGDPKKLIGAYGDTIHALDHVVKKMVEKQTAVPEAGADEQGSSLFLIDVDGYRTRQIQDLQTKALMMAERARSFQYDVELSPMSAYERLIVHTALQDAPNVKTESQGEGRNRRVVIRYTA